MDHRHVVLGVLANSDNELLRDSRLVDFVMQTALEGGLGGPLNAGGWPGEAYLFLSKLSFSELRDVHWLVERYYSLLYEELRWSGARHEALGNALRLMQARTVSLRLSYDGRMGHSLGDVDFIDATLKTRVGAQRYHARILDAGCGRGDLLSALRNAGYRNLVGVDGAPAAVLSARERLGRSVPVDIRCEVLSEYLTRQRGEFDCVVLGDVLEHMDAEAAVELLKLVRICTSEVGCSIIFNPWRLSGPHDLTREFRPQMSVPLGMHINEMSLREVRQLCLHAGYRRIEAGVVSASGRVCLLEPSVPGLWIKLIVEFSVLRMPKGLRRSVDRVMPMRALAAIP